MPPLKGVVDDGCLCLVAGFGPRVRVEVGRWWVSSLIRWTA